MREEASQSSMPGEIRREQRDSFKIDTAAILAVSCSALKIEMRLPDECQGWVLLHWMRFPKQISRKVPNGPWSDGKSSEQRIDTRASVTSEN
jgi:hypothetical protein